MSIIFNPKHKIIKITAAVVCVCFLWQDVVLAAGSSDFLRQRQMRINGESSKLSSQPITAQGVGDIIYVPKIEKIESVLQKWSIVRRQLNEIFNRIKVHVLEELKHGLAKDTKIDWSGHSSELMRKAVRTEKIFWHDRKRAGIGLRSFFIADKPDIDKIDEKLLKAAEMVPLSLGLQEQIGKMVELVEKATARADGNISKETLIEKLKETKGSQIKAAEHFGISQGNMSNIIRRYGLGDFVRELREKNRYAEIGQELDDERITPIMLEHVKRFSDVYDILCFNRRPLQITIKLLANRMGVAVDTVRSVIVNHHKTVDEWRKKNRLLPVIYYALRIPGDRAKIKKGSELVKAGFIRYIEDILKVDGKTLEDLEESDLGLNPKIKDRLIGPGGYFETWDIAKQYVFSNMKQPVKPDTQQLQEDLLLAEIEPALTKIKGAHSLSKTPGAGFDLLKAMLARPQRISDAAEDIVNIFAGKDNAQRYEILELLKQHNSPEAAAALYWILIEQDKKVDIDYPLAQKIIEYLGEMAKAGLGVAIKYLVDIRTNVDGINEGYRYRAIKALADSGQDIAFTHILNTVEGPLRDPDWAVKDLAAELLNEAGYNIAAPEAPVLRNITEGDKDVLEVESEKEEIEVTTLETLPNDYNLAANIEAIEEVFDDSDVEFLSEEDPSSLAGAAGGVTVKREYIKSDRDDRSDIEIKYDLNAREISAILRSLKEPEAQAGIEAINGYIKELLEDSDIKVRYSGWSKKGLAARSEFLRQRIRSYNSGFVNASKRLEQALKNKAHLEIKSALLELNSLNNKVVSYIKRRLFVQLLMAGMQLKEKDYSARTTEVLKGARNSYRALCWEYGWRRRRADTIILVERFRTIGAAGKFIFTFGFSGLDITCNTQTDAVIIRQQRWVVKQFPDGKIIYEPSWRDIEYKNLPDGLKSHTYIMASQEQDYMTVLYYMSLLDYAAERLEEFKDDAPFYIMSEVKEALNSTLSWAARGRVNQKKSAEGVEAILNSSLPLTERFSQCIDVLETRLTDIEDKKKGVAGRAEAIYIYIRNDDTLNGCAVIKAAVENNNYDSAYLEAERLRKTYFAADLPDPGYKFYRNRILSIIMALEMLSAQENYNANSELLRILSKTASQDKLNQIKRNMRVVLASILNIKSSLRYFLPKHWHNAIDGPPVKLITGVIDEVINSAKKYKAAWDKTQHTVTIGDKTVASRTDTTASEGANASGKITPAKLKALQRYDNSAKDYTKKIRQAIGRRFMYINLLRGVRENLKMRLVEHGYARKDDFAVCVSAVDRILFTWRDLKQYQTKSLQSLKNAANKAMEKIKRIQDTLKKYDLAQETSRQPQYIALYVLEICLRLEKAVDEADIFQYDLRKRLSGIAKGMRDWLDSRTVFPEDRFLSYAKALKAISGELGVGHKTREKLSVLAQRLFDLTGAKDAAIKQAIGTIQTQIKTAEGRYSGDNHLETQL